MQRSVCVKVLLACVIALAAWPTIAEETTTAPAAPAPSLSDPAPPSYRWEKRGAATGRPLLFLPALGFHGGTWEKVYTELEDKHPIHVGTLAGSDGVPATKPPYLERAVEDLRKYIEEQRLEQPVIVGHLLGAHIAMRVAGQYPDRVGGIFAVPLFARRLPVEMRAAHARALQEQFEKTPDELWLPNMRMRIRTVCNDPKLVDELTDIAAKADRVSYNGYVTDMMADPIEQWFPKITAPTVLVAPVVLPSKSASTELQNMSATEIVNMAVSELHNLFPNLAKCQFETVKDSRLFVMYEQPGRTTRLIERFLRKLDDPSAQWESTVGEAATTTAPAVP